MPHRLGSALEVFERVLDCSMTYGGPAYVAVAVALILSVAFVYFAAVLPLVRELDSPPTLTHDLILFCWFQSNLTAEMLDDTKPLGAQPGPGRFIVGFVVSNLSVVVVCAGLRADFTCQRLHASARYAFCCWNIRTLTPSAQQSLPLAATSCSTVHIGAWLPSCYTLQFLRL